MFIVHYSSVRFHLLGSKLSLASWCLATAMFKFAFNKSHVITTPCCVVQEKDKAITVLNKELSQSQDLNDRLSEETMAMEELRQEKEQLATQLEKVSGELEDFDRVSTPQVLTDQVGIAALQEITI